MQCELPLKTKAGQQESLGLLSFYLGMEENGSAVQVVPGRPDYKANAIQAGPPIPRGL